jgi:oxygen-independent coproporphyrinogen-3 oxidase
MTATAAAVALPDNPDRVLFEKYNIAGPRYTSYPTVPYWQNDLTPDAWVSHLDAELAAAATRGEKAGLYIHIPFCRSLCTFCACNKLVTQHRGRVEPYINAVLTEWATYLARLGVSQFPLAEMHLGGGTPTYLTGEELQRLLNPILERCETTGAALSFEADPRVTT